jgi:hypothetical protein
MEEMQLFSESGIAEDVKTKELSEELKRGLMKCFTDSLSGSKLAR